MAWNFVTIPKFFLGMVTKARGLSVLPQPVSIEKAEDRKLFNEAMEGIGVSVCPSGTASTPEDAKASTRKIGSYPLIIRPAFTMGGTGGGIAYYEEEFAEMAQTGIEHKNLTNCNKNLKAVKHWNLIHLYK